MGGDLKHWKRNKIENPGTLPITRGPSPLAAMRWTSLQTMVRMTLTSTTSQKGSFLPSRATTRQRFLAAPHTSYVCASSSRCPPTPPMPLRPARPHPLQGHPESDLGTSVSRGVGRRRRGRHGGLEVHVREERAGRDGSGECESSN